MKAKKKKGNWIRYLIPGFIFQSVVIGGGYGTGAELKEYFLSQGLLGGILGCIVTLVIWSILCAITFEFVRIFRTFNYKSMMDKLVGKAGIAYEICYIILLLIVLGVVNSTAFNMIIELTGTTGWIGIIILAIGITILVLKGTETIEKVLSFWSAILYVVYGLFLIICFVKFGDIIKGQWGLHEVGSNWFVGGVKYSFYNLGIIPALLYAIEETETRREAVIQGLLSGVIAIVPSILLIIALSGGVPETLEATVPVAVIFNKLDMNWLFWIFEIVLFGTLIETGTGFIKAVSDRFEHTFIEKKNTLPSYVRPTVTIICVVLGIVVSQFGLTDLISKGYGTICWGFFITFVIPMCTIGIYKIVKSNKKNEIAAN